MTTAIKPGLVHDGNYLVSFVDTVADISAPTVAELTAGLELECQLTPDGLGREASDETVDTSRLCSVFTTMKQGRTSFEVSMTLVRLDEQVSGVVDTAYATLVKRKLGYFVVRDNLPATVAWAAGQDVEVYPVECGTRSKANPAANEQQTFTIPMTTYADPDLYSVVAA